MQSVSRQLSKHKKLKNYSQLRCSVTVLELFASFKSIFCRVKASDNIIAIAYPF